MKTRASPSERLTPSGKKNQQPRLAKENPSDQKDVASPRERTVPTEVSESLKRDQQPVLLSKEELAAIKVRSRELSDVLERLPCLKAVPLAVGPELSRQDSMQKLLAHEEELRRKQELSTQTAKWKKPVVLVKKRATVTTQAWVRHDSPPPPTASCASDFPKLAAKVGEGEPALTRPSSKTSTDALLSDDDFQVMEASFIRDMKSRVVMATRPNRFSRLP